MPATETQEDNGRSRNWAKTRLDLLFLKPKSFCYELVMGFYDFPYVQYDAAIPLSAEDRNLRNQKQEDRPDAGPNMIYVEVR